MTADALSQDEIDALLRGAKGEPAPAAAGGSAVAQPTLTAKQLDAVKRYGDLMAATQGEMIGTFLATTARSVAKEPVSQTKETAGGLVSGPAVLAAFSYRGSLEGKAALVFKREDATKIGGTMVGDPEATEFSDMIADAFKEVLNTILGNLSTTLSGLTGGLVSLSQIEMDQAEPDSERLSLAIGGEDRLTLLPFELSVGADLKSECWQVLSDRLVESLDVLVTPPAPKPSTQPAKAAPVEFEALTAEPSTAAPANLDLIMDIGLEVRVELGRTNMKIRDVLNLGGGSVVELDKLAGEPVDLLVNDVIFAKGEVVVIDENFGVRITDILSLDDRIKSLGERKE